VFMIKDGEERFARRRGGAETSWVSGDFGSLVGQAVKIVLEQGGAEVDEEADSEGGEFDVGQRLLPVNGEGTSQRT
jgi:hypothetical protein